MVQPPNQKKVKFSDKERKLIGKFKKDLDKTIKKIQPPWRSANPVKEEIDNMDPTEIQVLEQEIARRDEVIRNIINLCAERKPADVLAAFGEEMTLRLRDIIADDKFEIQTNLLKPKEEEKEEEEDNEELEDVIETLLSMSEEDIEAIFENNEVPDEEKDALLTLLSELMDVFESESFEDLKNTINEMLETKTEGEKLTRSINRKLRKSDPESYKAADNYKKKYGDWTKRKARPHEPHAKKEYNDD